MDKAKIIAGILDRLSEELERQQQANARAAHSATDTESRAESKWDTQGLESSYLARGYAQQFETLSMQANELKSMELESFDGRPVATGALFHLELNGFQSWYLLLNGCGGMEVTVDEEEITVITPESPLAQAVLNKKAGDKFQFRASANARIISVI